MFDGIDAIRNRIPLIHCITNPISINDCANALLAIGAKPIMAEHPSEAAEITAISDGLALNMGNITDARLASMKLSAAAAKKHNIPFILDIVGLTCSTYRREYVTSFLQTFRPSIIKGNMAEIRALCHTAYQSIGIDAIEASESSQSQEAVLAENVQLVKNLAGEMGCTVLASGKTDIVSDGSAVCLIDNGSPKLPLITGTGCILNVLAAAALSVRSPFAAAAGACLCLGISGELADNATAQSSGLGSYHVSLLDALSNLSSETLRQYAKIQMDKATGSNI